MSVSVVSPMDVQRRTAGRPASASRLLAPLRLRRDQVPAGTYGERNRNPIEAAEAAGRHVLAQAWGWN